jgi:hypothetical protein
MSSVSYMPRESTYASEPQAAGVGWEPEAADVASWLRHGHVSSSFSLARVFGRPVGAEPSDQRLRARMTPGRRIVDLARL